MTEKTEQTNYSIDQNHIHVIGLVVQEPSDLKEFGDSCVSKLRIVSNPSKRDEETIWIDVDAWNATAKYALRNVKKGDKVSIYGYLLGNKWERKDKTKVDTFKIRASQITRLSSKQIVVEGSTEPQKSTETRSVPSAQVSRPAPRPVQDSEDRVMMATVDTDVDKKLAAGPPSSDPSPSNEQSPLDKYGLDDEVPF